MHVFVASKLKGKSVIRHVRLSIKTYFFKNYFVPSVMQVLSE